MHHFRNELYLDDREILIDNLVDSIVNIELYPVQLLTSDDSLFKFKFALALSQIPILLLH